MNEYARKLLAANSFREPVLRRVIESLNLEKGSRGLDAGCGLGLQVLLLSEAVGAAGHVAGLDQSAEFIRRARDISAEAGYSERVSFKTGDLYRLPFPDNGFDWIWSADCAGYPTNDPHGLIREMARVVRPGGRVILLYWSSEALLPGHPWLEARLRATVSGIAPFTKGMNPDHHPLNALGWFRCAGMKADRAETFSGRVCAPLSDDLREGMAALLDMRWSNLDRELTPEELAEYRRLCRPDSPDYILNRPDYYAFFTFTLFAAKNPD